MTSRLDCVVFDLDGTLTVPGGPAPVPGIVDALAALVDAGVALAVATSASTPVAWRVLAGLGVDRWFSSVAGAPPNGGSVGKDAVVAEALLGLGRLLPDDAPGVAVVGDGVGDMAAATRHGLIGIGAAWGGAAWGGAASGGAASGGAASGGAESGGAVVRALRAAGAVTVLHDPGDLPRVVVAGVPPGVVP